MIDSSCCSATLTYLVVVVVTGFAVVLGLLSAFSPLPPPQAVTSRAKMKATQASFFTGAPFMGRTAMKVRARSRTRVQDPDSLFRAMFRFDLQPLAIQHYWSTQEASVGSVPLR